MNDNDFQICSGCGLQIHKSRSRAHREDICRNFMKPIEEEKAVFKINQAELRELYKHRGTLKNNFNSGLIKSYNSSSENSSFKFKTFECFGAIWSMELYLEDIINNKNKIVATVVYLNLKLGDVTNSEYTLDTPLRDVTINIQLLANEDERKSFVTRPAFVCMLHFHN